MLPKYEPQFPSGLFLNIHAVLLTKTNDPKKDKLQGVDNLKFISDETKEMYIENAQPETIAVNLTQILKTLTPRMDKLQGVMLKNSTTGESHKMSINSIYGSEINEYILGGSS